MHLLQNAPVAFADSFLREFAKARAFADSAVYTDQVYPGDGALYPGICIDIPSWLERDMMLKLRRVGFREIRPKMTFLRMSTQGKKVPHRVHTDAMVGQWTFLCYLSESEDGGTGFYAHKQTGQRTHPRTAEDVAIWSRDQHDLSLWDQVGFVPMENNRAVLFPSDLYHCALPLDGFGNSALDARIVLTCFFNALW